jgi:hypothetical protein
VDEEGSDLSMLRRLSFLFISWMFCQSLLAQESFMTILGVPIPNQYVLKESGETLNLNGHAVRKYQGQEMYVAALYTDHIEKKPEMLLINDDPMAMVFFFVQDDVSDREIREIFVEHIVINNKDHGIFVDKNRLLELTKAIDQTLHAGDILIFQYSPKTGLTLLINDQVKYQWPHAKTFFNMILRMWIGPFPPSRSFKRAILNFPV